MDGVPGGYQPTAEDKAKAAKASSIDIYNKDEK
jgi:hypothetical protein